MVHRQIGRGGRHGGPAGLRAELDLLAPTYRQAVHAAEKAYADLGIRHALIGGIAAGAYGQPRATADIDYLVGDEAFDVRGPIISIRAGLPIDAYGIVIDSVPIPDRYRALGEEALALARPSNEPEVRIAAPEHLVALKLIAGRTKDYAAVEEMLSSGGVTEAAARELLQRLGDDELLSRFARALASGKGTP